MSDAVLNQFTKEETEETKATGKKLRVGIIGTGWIAESHIEVLKMMDDVEIVAGADLIPGRGLFPALRCGGRALLSQP